MSATTNETQAIPYAPSAETLGAVLTFTERPPRPSAVSASVTFGWRAMLKFKHVPEQLIDVTAFPALITLLFSFLFGGAIAGSTKAYLQYFLPGIMVTGVLMITMYTGAAINGDIQKGIFDRFRTLSIWRPAPMVGYLLGDVFRYTMASTVILVLGLIIGFRPHGGVGGVIAGMALLVAFAFAFSWLFTMLGMLMRDEKSVMNASFLLFPVTFLSNVFVQPKTMPGWLQAIVKVNPVTHVVGAVRGLMTGHQSNSDLFWTPVWGVAFIAVFGTLTMRLYNRK
jgi:ABC-2 type transport system permease protein